MVRSHALRDTDPVKWYGPSGIYNDLPPKYAENVNQDPPFGRKPGGKPTLDADEIDAIVAFPKTPTDGFQTE